MTGKHAKWGWMFVSPYIFSLLAFTLIPLIVSIYLSFCRYDMFRPPVWRGLKNFTDVLTNEQTWEAFRNTWLFAVMHVSLDISISCVLAVLLNQKIKGIGIYRVIYFLPVLTPMTACAMVWNILYQPTEEGIFNILLGFVGIGPLQFNNSTNVYEIIFSVMLVTLWKGMGSTTVYLLAGLQGINSDVMEAAEIDGANAVQKFFKITIPLVTPTIFFLLITGMAGALGVFEQFFVLTETSATRVDVINGLIYNWVWRSEGKIGLASALGWISFVFVAALTIAQKVGEKRWVHYE